MRGASFRSPAACRLRPGSASNDLSLYLLSEPGYNGGGEQRAGPRRGSLTGPFDGYLLYLLKLFAVGVFDPFRFLEVEPPNEEVCDCLKDCGDHATYSTCQNLAWKAAHHDQANQLDADESKQPYQ